jgi:hypothetical protein
MKRSIEWAAGLFEGEGCITCYTQANKTWAMRTDIHLKMTDEDVVQDFADTLELKATGPHKESRPNCKPYFRVRVGKKSEVRRILLLMLPHLGSRRACKALDALDIIECNLSPEEYLTN